MRWTIDNAEFGLEIRNSCFVTVDDVVQTGVLGFDTDEGWVRKLILDEAGHAQVNESGTAVLEEFVNGVVRLVPRADRPGPSKPTVGGSIPSGGSE